ncbi:phosphatase PAP2 family protein [Sphingomonas sp. 2R-10]|uniref:acid phosphatase n=1 Tax=Sphingomonas sp. 2R-10 TaxID=3045148 RepID=UPI0019D07EF4|nr:phosphatase PAP2 family protein [Sphingomonas sp. 2R-10]MDJ0277149.1 phosphatase PAP2 family protein [Sphingomonas sp. 2R-10]
MVSLRIAALAISCAIALPIGAVSQTDITGFLAPGEFDVIPALEPAPQPGDPRFMSDRQIFRATRRLTGTPRWRLAITDADESMSAMMRNYSCAVGAALTPATAPKLAALMRKVGKDTAGQSARAKVFFRRNRPFIYDAGAICQPKSALIDPSTHRFSYDYPSGHTTWGWTWALILASVAPDRATQILARGRAYGDSRYICGAHNRSAVEAGMQSASATMTVVAAKPEYQSQLRDVRDEVSALRRSTTMPPTSQCEGHTSKVGLQ